jgi:hypothetical protein
MLLGDGFGRLLQRITEYFGIRNYHFNNSIHQLFDPGEEDMYLISSGSEASAYWGFIFPRNGKDMFITDDSSDEHLEKWMNAYQYTLKYATCRSGGKRLLLKNPPNTGRIRLLLKLFPNAKFIYIHRNPYTLYYSMKNLWNKVITKYYSLQHITDEESDNTIYNYYSKLTDKYEEERNLIPEGNLVEISYEELESDPVETIRKIYYELNLPSFAFMQAALSNRLELEHQYRKFSYRYNNHELDRTASAWKTEIAHRGYVRPVTSPT